MKAIIMECSSLAAVWAVSETSVFYLLTHRFGRSMFSTMDSPCSDQIEWVRRGHKLKPKINQKVYSPLWNSNLAFFYRWNKKWVFFIQWMSVESNAALDFIDFHCIVKTEHSSEYFILCSTEKKKVKKI